MRIRHIIGEVLILYFGFNLLVAIFIGLGGIAPKFVWWAHAPIKAFVLALRGGTGTTILAILAAFVILGIIVVCFRAPVKVSPHPRHLGLPPSGRR